MPQKTLEYVTSSFILNTSPRSIESSELMYKALESGVSHRPADGFLSEAEEEDHLSAALNVSMLDVYRGKLKSRHRRKRVIREYGLLNKPKAISLPSRYPHLNGSKYESLYRYGSRLMCAMDFDFMLEGLHHEMMLRQQILHLQEYRQSGLKKFAAIDVFHKMKVSSSNFFCGTELRK